MKVTEKVKKVNRRNELLACYDVSQNELHFLTEYELDDKCFVVDDKVVNDTRAITEHFRQLEKFSHELGYDNIHVVFEASGGYERTLKHLAKQREYKLSHVSGEATKRARTIESNDNGKSDQKDKAIILTLAQMSKVLSCRVLQNNYSCLRQLGIYYEEVSQLVMSAREKIAGTAKFLFYDMSKKSSFLYTATGKALIKLYGFNPYKITKGGYGKFRITMLKHVMSIKERQLIQMFDNAKIGKKILTEQEADIFERQLLWHYDEFKRGEAKKEEIKEEMIATYMTTEEYSN